jgi:hypothetical protein
MNNHPAVRKDGASSREEEGQRTPVRASHSPISIPDDEDSTALNTSASPQRNTTNETTAGRNNTTMPSSRMDTLDGSGREHATQIMGPPNKAMTAYLKLQKELREIISQRDEMKRVHGGFSDETEDSPDHVEVENQRETGEAKKKIQAPSKQRSGRGR